MFVRFLPELVQDSVCLGDVLNRFRVLPVLFRRTFIGRHICLHWVTAISVPILPRQSFNTLSSASIYAGHRSPIGHPT
jgi:hypothetical protein